MAEEFPFAIRRLNSALSGQTKALNRLSSGKRINSAADDAAGLAIVEALSASAAQRSVAIRNGGDAVSLGATAESSLGQIGEISTRLSELAIQASNGTLSDVQRSSLQQEYTALTQEVNRIAQSTEFNGIKPLASDGAIAFQVGTGSGSESQISVEGANISSLAGSISSQDISTQAGAQNALAAVSSFRDSVVEVRGRFGAASSRIEVANSNSAVQRENELAAASRIRDADIAEEVANKTKFDILAQSALAVNAQANKLSGSRVKALLG